LAIYHLDKIFNPRMIAVFKKRGFSVEIDPATSLVEVAKNIV